jgi:hypothetical protein
LTPHPWSPKPRTLTTLSSPHKRKRDVPWSTQRITETTMQKILHNFTHTAHTHTEDATETTSPAQDDESGGEWQLRGMWGLGGASLHTFRRV